MNTKIFLVILILCLIFTANFALANGAPLNGLNSSVTIYVYPPRRRIDWSTPKSALKSFIGNLFRILISKNSDVEFVDEFQEVGTLSSRYKSSMGHTIGHVRCALPGGEIYDRWTSLSGQDMMSVDKQILIKDKVGLGALFYDYVDGHIIAGAGNILRLIYHKGKREDGSPIRPRYMQFELDAEHCAKIKEMVTFFESFHFPKGTTLEDLENSPPERLLYFTNTMDPYESYMARMQTGRGLVGGGCAPYGAALIKAGGRFNPALDPLWKTPVQVSEKLIGGTRDKETGELRRVSLGRLIFTKLGSHWSYKNEGIPSRKLSLYDPQKIWDFTGDVFACLAKVSWCPAATRAILKTESGKIQRGLPRIFTNDPSDKLFHEALASGSAEAARAALEEAKLDPASQKVHGFVWRLR